MLPHGTAVTKKPTPKLWARAAAAFIAACWAAEAPVDGIAKLSWRAFIWDESITVPEKRAPSWLCLYRRSRNILEAPFIITC